MRSAFNPTACPDDNALAAYIEGGLPMAEREAIAAHVATCSSCRALVAAVVPETGDPAGLPDRPALGHRRRRWLPLAAAGLLATAAAAVFVLRSPAETTTPLVEATSGFRFAEGRLTGGFTWAPVGETAMRGASPTTTSGDITIAVGQLEKALAADRSATNLAAYGVSRLAILKAGEAVDALVEATTLDRSSAPAWSDLSVAYLSRSREPGRDGDLPAALDAADRALRLQPALPEALFNKAIVLERLGLLPQAIDVWKQYLEADPSSPWRAEATAHLQRLATPPASRGSAPASPEALRRRFDDALRIWATASDDGRPEAVAAMRASLDGLVDSRAEHRAESQSMVLVDRAAGQPADARRIIDAHRSFFATRALVDTAQYSDAAEAAGKTMAELARVGSPLVFEARYLDALTTYRRQNRERAASLFLDLSTDPRLSDFPIVAGKTDWMIGLIDASAGRWSSALARYAAAAEAFGRASEPTLQVSLLRNVASVHDALGDPQAGWSGRIQAQRVAPAVIGTWLQASWAALAQDMPHAALDFAAEGHRLAVAAQSTPNIADALRLRAGVLLSLGDADAARALIAETDALLARHGETGWDDVRAELAVVRATATGADPARVRIMAATRAIDFFTGRKAVGRLPELLLVRARLHAEVGDGDAARRDVLEGFGHLTASRDQVTSSTSRAAAESVAHGLAEELARLATSEETAAAAFDAIDATRGRDVVTGGPPRETWAMVAETLPADSALVAFVVAEQETYVWVAGRERRAFRSIPVGRARLRDLVAAASHPRFDRSSADTLADQLLGPVRALQPGLRELVIVPDGPLRELPFALLFDPSGVASQPPAVVAVPSAAAWVSATRRLAHGARPTTVVAIGNPALDAEAAAGLTNLPEAEREAIDVAGQYARRHVVTGPRATSAVFSDALRSADVVHFAGHAVLVRTVLDGSYIALAGGRDGRLTAAAIRNQRGVNARLVVLAGCETASRDAGSRAESAPLSLSRAVLAAGVPTVVGTLWPLGDRASRALFTAFHREFAKTGDAAWSLRHAQAWMRSSGDPVLTSAQAWAGVVVMGGSARGAEPKSRG